MWPSCSGSPVPGSSSAEEPTKNNPTSAPSCGVVTGPGGAGTAPAAGVGPSPQGLGGSQGVLPWGWVRRVSPWVPIPSPVLGGFLACSRNSQSVENTVLVPIWVRPIHTGLCAWGTPSPVPRPPPQAPCPIHESLPSVGAWGRRHWDGNWGSGAAVGPGGLQPRGPAASLGGEIWGWEPKGPLPPALSLTGGGVPRASTSPALHGDVSGPDNREGRTRRSRSKAL